MHRTLVPSGMIFIFKCLFLFSYFLIFFFFEDKQQKILNAMLVALHWQVVARTQLLESYSQKKKKWKVKFYSKLYFHKIKLQMKLFN